jgi:glycosyltransferase involved in cell wall biosynthesis
MPAGQVEAAEGNPSVYRLGRHREWDATMPHTMNLLDWLSTRNCYSAVWGHYVPVAGFAAVWFGRLRAVPSIVSVRGNDLDRDVFPPGDFARLDWTLRKADLVTAVTLELAKKVTALAGRDDVIHFRNTVDSDVFRPEPPDPELRAALGIHDAEAVLGFAGELREKKGLQHLLDALRFVQQRRRACLLIIGDVRPSEMPRMFQILGPGALAEHRVLITGQLAGAAEVNRHLHLCDVFLQPSLWDGMPNALLEAMSAGCGCVVSDAGGIPEMITPGIEGIVLPRWQLHRLGEAVLEWLNAPDEERDRVRAAARARAANAFGRQQERQALETILGRIAQCSSITSASDLPARSHV